MCACDHELNILHYIYSTYFRNFTENSNAFQTEAVLHSVIKRLSGDTDRFTEY